MYKETLTELFEEKKNKDNAAQMSKYMKFHFPFLGIKSPDTKLLLREFFKKTNILKEEKLPEAFFREVWELPEREFQYAVLTMLVRRPKWLTSEDMEFVEELITTKSWWDTVDTTASNIVGELFLREPLLVHKHIPVWKSHENMWLRRTAILFQLKYKAETDEELLFHIIRLNMADREFFIRKAIGWALREYSKTKPEVVKAFIEEESAKLSNLSIREGMKHIKKEPSK